ncbi:hypothetical protein J4Q44_G00290610 [Coregonus suidteri]|uniref:Uncharacterized protein n=1 Tax=Coregonus suidteri TaxID=861788 RepID=A0AAN8QKI0_9TELE
MEQELTDLCNHTTIVVMAQGRGRILKILFLLILCLQDFTGQCQVWCDNITCCESLLNPGRAEMEVLLTSPTMEKPEENQQRIMGEIVQSQMQAYNKNELVRAAQSCTSVFQKPTVVRSNEVEEREATDSSGGRRTGKESSVTDWSSSSP